MELKDLITPFPASDVEWRFQSSDVKNNKPWAKVLCYITNRAIMDRLDNAVGPGLWRNEFKEGPGGGILCGISILINDHWVTKWDGAENTKVEAIKGGLSSAMKRAAVQWGIGRYLYHLEADWANFNDKGVHSNKINGKYYKWSPPKLPSWALPQGSGKPSSLITEKDQGRNATQDEPTGGTKQSQGGQSSTNGGGGGGSQGGDVEKARKKCFAAAAKFGLNDNDLRAYMENQFAEAWKRRGSSLSKMKADQWDWLNDQLPAINDWAKAQQ